MIYFVIATTFDRIVNKYDLLKYRLSSVQFITTWIFSKCAEFVYYFRNLSSHNMPKVVE